MSLEQPYFNNRFVYEDFQLIHKLRWSLPSHCNPHHPHNFSPLLLINSKNTQYRKFSCADRYNGKQYETWVFKTTRWAFAEKIYQMALADAHLVFPDMCDVTWCTHSPNWQQLILPPSHRVAAEYMRERMKEICNHGDTFVMTGFYTEHHYSQSKKILRNDKKQSPLS